MPSLASFPGMMQRYRKREGLRVCRAPWLVGVSVRKYREIEAGDRAPSPDTYQRIPSYTGDRRQMKGGIVAEYLVREEGKNGKVEVFDDRIVRTRKKTLGKDDVQTIPITAVTGVSHDRKTLGTDEVKLIVGSVTYEWKVKNAEAMVAELHTKMFAAGSGVPAAMAPEGGPSQGTDKVASLERLASLHASGALSDDEYASMKAEVLGSDPGEGQTSAPDMPRPPDQP